MVDCANEQATQGYHSVLQLTISEHVHAIIILRRYITLVQRDVEE